MLGNLFIHKIIAVREINPKFTSLGEYLSSSSVAIASGSSTSQSNYFIPARWEEYDEIVQYRESNLREFNKTIIYIPANYHIEQHDKIYIEKKSIGMLGGGYLLVGIVNGVNTAVKGFSQNIDHYELIIENT